MQPISNCCGAEMHWNDMLAERCPQCHENCIVDEDNLMSQLLTWSNVLK
jgi:hypothetical protein